MPFIVSIFSAGLVMIVFSSCGRREANSGKHSSLPVVSSSLTVITSGPASARAVVGRSESTVNVVPPAKGRGVDESDQPAEREMATGEGLQKSALSEDATSSVAAVKMPVGDIGSSQMKALVTPLVAVGLSPALKLNAQQAQQAVKLAEDFLAATADESADASGTSAQVASTAAATSTDAKAAFEARWSSAQQKSDDQFRAWFGYDAFNAMQIRRSQQQYQDQQAGK